MPQDPFAQYAVPVPTGAADPFAAFAVARPSVPAPVRPPIVSTGGGRGTGLDVRKSGDVARGVRAGAATTVYGGGDLLRRATGQPRILHEPDVQAAMTAPDSWQGQLGFGVERAAEFAIPLARVSKAVAGAALPVRMAAEAAAGAGVGAVQTGGDPIATGLSGVVAGAFPAASVTGRAVWGAVRRVAAGAAEGGLGGAVASAVRKVAPEDPRTMMVQGIKPRSTKVNFLVSLDRAMPEIKVAEAVIKKPVESIDSLIEGTTAAKREIQRQLDQVRGTAQGLEIDGSSVADAMRASIPSKLRLENPAAAKAFGDMADAYRRPFSLDEMETLLRETNAELEGYFALYPTAQRKAVLARPEVAAIEAQGRALRAAIDAGLDRMADGAGAAAKELRRRYGALLDVEGETWRRANVAKRQQPESLAEQIAGASAAADRAAGAFRMGRGVMTGSPRDVIGGGADLIRGQVRRETAKFLKEQQTTDALIRRAFAGYTKTPAPIEMPVKRAVRGALGPGPIITPPPADPSFVRGVPAQPARRDLRGLLGAASPPTPPRRVFEMPGTVAPDPSGGGSIPAAPIDYAIDPTVRVKPGGFRVAQFSGDPRAAKAAVASPEVRAMLQRMQADLDTFVPERGRLIRDPRDRGSSIYAHGGPGSPVGDDIRVISEQNVGNRAIQGAIRDLLEGKMPTNRLHTGALDAAMGYLEKRPGYRGPSVPDWVVNPDDGFEAFSRAVDDVSRER